VGGIKVRLLKSLTFPKGNDEKAIVGREIMCRQTSLEFYREAEQKDISLQREVSDAHDACGLIPK
jgi:hypothetical protein